MSRVFWILFMVVVSDFWLFCFRGKVGMEVRLLIIRRRRSRGGRCRSWVVKKSGDIGES